MHTGHAKISRSSGETAMSNLHRSTVTNAKRREQATAALEFSRRGGACSAHSECQRARSTFNESPPRHFSPPLNSAGQTAKICEPWYTRSKPPSESETVSIGEIQNSCAPGAESVTATF